MAAIQAQQSESRPFQQAELQAQPESVIVVTQATPMIELYQKEDCPYSHTVRSRLTELGLDFVAHTIPDNNAFKHRELLEAGGRDQIPFLIDRRTETRLYDSNVILGYLDREYGTGSQPRSESRLIQTAKNLDSRLRQQADQLVWRMKAPVNRARQLGHDVQELWGTMRGTLLFVGKMFGNLVPSRRSGEGASSSSKSDMSYNGS
jgi:glutaredoxin